MRMIDTSAPGYRPFKPNWSSPCLCGSGRKFRDCCHGRLAGYDSSSAVQGPFDRGDWPKALLAARAAITQYTIWHWSHTAPRHLGIFKVDERMLRIDLNALSSHVATLGRIYNQLDRTDQFLRDLVRLRGNIDDPRWGRKIAYHRAVVLMVTGDRAAAGEALAEAGPVTSTEEDVEVIQAHLDLNGEALGHTDRHALMGRILELSPTRLDILQYTGARAMNLVMIGDEDGAAEEFREAVRRGHGMEEDRPLSPREEHWLCLALEGLAVTTREEDVFEELVRRWRGLIDRSENWTPFGQVGLWRGLADALRYWDRWDEAVVAYRRAHDLGAKDAMRIFEAESLAWTGKADEALQLLTSLSHQHFSVAEEADYAFIYYFAAHRSQTLETIEHAIELLRQAETPASAFETRRLELLHCARDDLAALNAQKPLPTLSWPLRGLKAISRYAMLQPNWNGVGVNFNLMIDDAVERAEKRGRNKE